MRKFGWVGLALMASLAAAAPVQAAPTITFASLPQHVVLNNDGNCNCFCGFTFRDVFFCPGTGDCTCGANFNSGACAIACPPSCPLPCPPTLNYAGPNLIPCFSHCCSKEIITKTGGGTFSVQSICFAELLTNQNGYPVSVTGIQCGGAHVTSLLFIVPRSAPCGGPGFHQDTLCGSFTNLLSLTISQGTSGLGGEEMTNIVINSSAAAPEVNGGEAALPLAAAVAALAIVADRRRRL
ncbi:MAG TPA: hypothetical protein VGO93_19045 [Candidatus Xenobia bacterium]|jgi:hypothetical protein